jgi:hypothetical protein
MPSNTDWSTPSGLSSVLSWNGGIAPSSAALATPYGQRLVVHVGVGQRRDAAGSQAERAVELARHQLVLELLGHRLARLDLDGRIALHVRLDQTEAALPPARERKAQRHRAARLLEAPDGKRVLRGLQRDASLHQQLAAGLGQLDPARGGPPTRAEHPTRLRGRTTRVARPPGAAHHSWPAACLVGVGSRSSPALEPDVIDVDRDHGEALVGDAVGVVEVHAPAGREDEAVEALRVVRVVRDRGAS